MKISGSSWIGYELSNINENKFSVYFPDKKINSEYSFCEVSESEIILAIKKAKYAFEIYRKSDSKLRSEFLKLIAIKLDENRNILIETFCNESGLPLDRANNELNRTIFQLELFADCIKDESWKILNNSFSDSKLLPKEPKLLKKLIPLGVAVVFAASNFPFAYSTIGGDVVAALSACCPVIVKAHYMHAGTSDLVSQIVLSCASKCGFPDGVFSNLNGISNEFSKKLVQNEDVKIVAFTGSFQGSSAIKKYIDERKDWIPFFAEMGSVNPIFISNLACNIDDTVKKISNSISNNAGQFCTNPGLIFCMNEDVFNTFSTTLAKYISLESDKTMLHTSIQDKFICKIKSISALNKTKVLIDENISYNGKLKPIIYTMSVDDFLSNNIFQDEVFGSFSIIIKCRNINDFYKVSEYLKGQISCSIFYDETQHQIVSDLIEILSYKCGRIIKNDVPTGVTVHQSMHHGGPFPASSDSRFTAVGPDSIFRFLRPICLQGF